MASGRTSATAEGHVDLVLCPLVNILHGWIALDHLVIVIARMLSCRLHSNRITALNYNRRLLSTTVSAYL